MTWPVVPLRDVLSSPLVNGRSVKDEAGGFPVLRLSALREHQVDLSESKAGAWTRSDAERYLVAEGDFLVARGNGSLKLVGRGALVSSMDREVAFPDTMIRVRARSDRIESRFLAYVWNARQTRDQVERLARTTAGIYKVNQSHLESIELPLPPVEKQRQIVVLLEDHLSRLDAATSYLASLRRRLRSMERSALDSLFGGADVPLDGMIDDISAGKSFGGANAPARDDEWGIIKVSAMTWGEFDPAENKAVAADRVDPRFEIRGGDLLVSRANTEEYVGASVLVGQVRSRLLLSDKSLRLTPKAGVRPAWLWRALQAPSARRQITALATGTKESMRNISQESLKKVLLPSATESEQAVAVSDFVETAAAIGRMRAELDSAERRCAALRRAVLAAAFSGRLTGHREIAGV